MRRFVLVRMARALPVLIGVLLLQFWLIHLPADQDRIRDLNPGMTASQIEDSAQRHRAMFRLDEPFFARFGGWLGDVATLDFKTSMRTFEPVRSVVGRALGRTLLVQIPVLFLVFAVGIPLGVWGARRRETKRDTALGVLLLASIAVPTFWSALLLRLGFSTDAGVRLMPLGGLHSRDAEFLGIFAYTADVAWHLILPVAALGLPAAAVVARYLRASLSEELEKSYVRTLRAAGFSERVVVWRYTLRNALTPIVTLFGALVPSLVGGSIVIETIFGIEGMGALLVRSTYDHDYPVLQAIFLLVAVMTLGGYLIADVGVAALDPRSRDR